MHKQFVMVLSVILFSTGSELLADSKNDEKRPASFESLNLMAMVKNLAPAPNWIGNEDRFWVKNENMDGVRYRIVNLIEEIY
ncbi:MAG TPA: hypothetical protein QGI69_04955 [Candidatus Marinimicrobia bacterium]|jgi:hypothetical protein|nr:hypothetical protein [Candidatus Neomarinimicrobiota bacterium]HJM84599.1 hypothetical protein [Candidatus Neomarinimicrobiota bacterium]|tara:strand:+ start:8057 stop:8302 length:246 start_codon:yes stop_codon:yes gene_type:complete